MLEQQNKQDVSVIGFIFGVFALIAILGGVFHFSLTGTTSSPTSQTTTVDQATPVDQSTPITQPTAAPGWTIFQTYAGSGPKKTEKFSVPGNWRIVWACYGMSGITGGSEGALSVEVMGADNSYVDASAVSVNCKANTTTTDFTTEHQSGKVYLNMIAAGDWTVEVQVPSK